MRCAVCGGDCIGHIHKFYTGTLARPDKTWIIAAPLYFKSTADFRGMVEPYCSLPCSVIGHSGSTRSAGVR